MELLDNAQWQQFRQAINDASDTFNNAIVIWKHVTKRLAFSGDERNPDTIEQRNLRALIQYNVYKLWPSNRETETGALDKESIAMILNKEHVSALGYLTADGHLDFNPETDTFMVDGEEFYPDVDTPVSQASTSPLLLYIILKKTQPITGTTKY